MTETTPSPAPDQPDLAPRRPVTGDPAVDSALEAFDRAMTDSAAGQLEAAVEAHRVLQQRLTTPTSPATPGQPRPAPPL